MLQVIEIKFHAIVTPCEEGLEPTSSLADFYTFLAGVIASKLPISEQDSPLFMDQYFDLRLHFSLDNTDLYNSLVEYIHSIFTNGLVDISQSYRVRTHVCAHGDTTPGAECQPWVILHEGGAE